ncbi:MAG: hypothetical protein CSA33_00775 [Desulfobulbus propionicus]|nr:MAG: hypothetical protein CSA33_00775 [Desulfobulbus propionicus]
MGMIDHTQLRHFRRGLQFSQLINVLVYIFHYFCRSGPLDTQMIHGVDSTETANDSKLPSYSIEINGKSAGLQLSIAVPAATSGTSQNRRRATISTAIILFYLQAKLFDD